MPHESAHVAIAISYGVPRTPGPTPFKRDAWTTHAFTIPGKYLHDNVNTLKIQNIEDSDNLAGAPWFMLTYVVIRVAK